MNAPQNADDDVLPPVTQTIDRFLFKCRFKGKTESLGGGGQAVLPDDQELSAMAHDLSQAATQDPYTFRVLGDMKDEAGLRALLKDALDALRARGRNAVLSSIHQSALEAIILLQGRPAILISNDTFPLPRGEWELLAAARDEMRAVIRSVGRISVAPELGRVYDGTGFVVAPGQVMTNWHVVKDYVLHDGKGGYELLPGVGMKIDFKQEFGSAARSVFEITAVQPHPDPNQVDLALLQVKEVSDDGLALPPPLRLQMDPEYVSDSNIVYVVGYPGADPERNDAEQMHRIFEGVYEKKRLAPGRIVSTDAGEKRLVHDCSTLGGNSGSCVVDFATQSVIGLHFEGEYLKSNRAVLLPVLAQDPLLRGLNFKAGRDGLGA